MKRHDGPRSRDGMDDMLWLADRFEEHRPRLRSVAYRLLGSLTEAEGALQEAWTRTSASDGRTIDNVGAWLITLVGRVCVDRLRARKSRSEDLGGGWLPEPVVSTGEAVDPEQESLLADSVGLALLVVLETLEPAERLAFVPHDMFAVVDAFTSDADRDAHLAVNGPALEAAGAELSRRHRSSVSPRSSRLRWTANEGH